MRCFGLRRLPSPCSFALCPCCLWGTVAVQRTTEVSLLIQSLETRACVCSGKHEWHSSWICQDSKAASEARNLLCILSIWCRDSLSFSLALCKVENLVNRQKLCEVTVLHDPMYNTSCHCKMPAVCKSFSEHPLSVKYSYFSTPSADNVYTYTGHV